MKELIIKGNKSTSELLVGESIGNLGKYLPSGKVVVITDTIVDSLYRNFYRQYPVIVIGTGEQIKNLSTIAQIYSEMLKLEVDRSWFIVGVGGGIVCDIAGYAAATYMRGLKFGFVSTTLLSQVDASVGGKNGVNFEGYKNHIGTFNQPEFVICDPEMLKTLPSREVLSGFGEIVKHALIADENMFKYLEDYYPEAINLNSAAIEQLIYTSIVIKSGVVNRDETEQGERRTLNFGHTLAHAIEKCTPEYTHGEAVAIGMAAAAGFSFRRGRITSNELKRIIALLKNLGLPVNTTIPKESLIAAMQHDKKREDKAINLVLLNGIGKCEVLKMPVETTIELAAALDFIDG